MYQIDSAGSFTATMLLAVEKTADREGVLQTNAEGTQKWRAQVAAVMVPNGRRNQAEVLKVGIATDRDLAAEVPVGPVQLVNLRLGTFTQQDGGLAVYFQADDIKPSGGFPSPSKAAAHQGAGHQGAGHQGGEK